MERLPLTIRFWKVRAMRKKKIHRDPLQAYPDTLSMGQLRAICHISKKTAAHLLENGLIPSVNTGKMTHKYRIAKADVVTFLERRGQNRKLYSAPKGWYRSGRDALAASRNPRTKEELDAIMTRFIELLAYYPDVMCIEEVAKFTGYTKSSVADWCNKGKLGQFDMGTRHMILKAYLLDFIMGPGFRGMRAKRVKMEESKHV